MYLNYSIMNRMNSTKNSEKTVHRTAHTQYAYRFEVKKESGPDFVVIDSACRLQYLLGKIPVPRQMLNPQPNPLGF